MDWVRSCFPRARVSAPGGRFACIRHRVRRDAVSRHRLERIRTGSLFFDLETLGFLGHPVFLIGALRRRPSGCWEVTQFLARDYTEEEGIVRAFCRIAEPASCWISFNGKSFDWPFLRARAAYYGVRVPAPAEHLDLLHAARRAYRGVLPNCRLRTLEWRLLGHYRTGDLSSGEVPAAYHAFVRTGSPDAMERVLRHNRADLFSLARLLVEFDEPDAPAGDTPDPSAPGGLDRPTAEEPDAAAGAGPGGGVR